MMLSDYLFLAAAIIVAVTAAGLIVWYLRGLWRAESMLLERMLERDDYYRRLADKARAKDAV